MEKGKISQKLSEWKMDARRKVEDTKDWCMRHKNEIVIFGPVIAGSVVELLKISSKRHNVKEEKRLKDNYIYDRSNGHYWETRRKVRSDEWQMIELRKSNGERLGDILDDMKLLK